MSHDEAGLDRKVLAHDAWPGYDRAFTIVFAAALIYLGIIYAVTGTDYVAPHDTTHAPAHGEAPAHGTGTGH